MQACPYTHPESTFYSFGKVCMSTLTTATTTPSQSATHRATYIIFLQIGILFSSWAPLIPYVKQRLGLDESALGMLLLCFGIGSLVAMPFAGMLVARFGCRKVIVPGMAALCVLLPNLAITPNVPLTAIILFVFGAIVGILDVAINVQAVLVEKAADRSMMSIFHGLGSLGGIIGTAIMSFLIWWGLAPFGSALTVILISAVLLTMAASGLLRYGSESESAKFAFPRGIVLLLGVVCFISFLVEGAVQDWGAVYLHEQKQAPQSLAAWGYTVFLITMTICRFYGAAIVRRLGDQGTVLIGAFIAVIGWLLVIAMPSWIASLLGFGLLGMGCSNIVPIMFSAVGRQSQMPANMAMASVAQLGYIGVLLGPALIGFVAESTSLNISFIMLACGMAVIAISTRWLRTA